MLDTLECYKILDVPPGTSPKLVRKAYVALCQVWHPDRFQTNPILRKKAAERMAEIQKAYDTLCEFLPELERPGTQAPEESLDESPVAILDERPDLDSGWPLRYTVFLLLLIVLLLVALIGVATYYRHQAYSSGAIV